MKINLAVADKMADKMTNEAAEEREMEKGRRMGRRRRRKRLAVDRLLLSCYFNIVSSSLPHQLRSFVIEVPDSGELVQ